MAEQCMARLLYLPGVKMCNYEVYETCCLASNLVLISALMNASINTDTVGKHV